jgi:membrane-associated phospholipid phosphatase
MLSYLTSDLSWVLPLRTPELTLFFRAFPFFASDLFYVSVIAIGFWSWKRNIFDELAFVVCTGTLLNVLLKCIINLPRPSIEMLILADQTHEFPSGDIQVAVTFWITFIKLLHRNSFWYVAIPLLILMGLSRIYLGAHSPMDVVGGVLVGVTYAYSYFSFREAFWTNYLQNPLYYILVTLALIRIYFYFIPWMIYPVAIVSGGLLFGVLFAELLRCKFELPAPPTSWPGKITIVMGGMTTTFILYDAVKQLAHLSESLFPKFAGFVFIALYILYIWPKMADLITQVYSKKSTVKN